MLPAKFCFSKSGWIDCLFAGLTILILLRGERWPDILQIPDMEIRQMLKQEG